MKPASFFEGILQQKDRCGFLKHKWYYKIKIKKLKKGFQPLLIESLNII